MSAQQKLVDIVFSVGLSVRSNASLRKLADEELAVWIAQQLEGCGFHTKPMGSSWGVLCDPDTE